MADIKQAVKEKIQQIKEAGNFVIFPEGFEYSNVSDYWYNFEIATGVPYKCKGFIYEDGDTYLYIYGSFGRNDDGYEITELEELTDEEILSLEIPSDDMKEKLAKLKEFEDAIAKAVNDYKQFSKENKLGASVEWSTDEGTIAEWNSSRC